MVTVAVNDRPIPAVAVVRQGRVLLPLRATFAALGATVQYDPQRRVVVAKTLVHAVRLEIGSRIAQLDGKTARLDVPPQILAGETFVPIRFVAQAFGARVSYDAQDALVSIAVPEELVLSRAHVMGLMPAAGAQVATAYPNIAASLSGGTAANGDVMLTVDGKDVTALSSFDGSTVTYLPRTALPIGSHTVVFSGKDDAGNTFSSQWNFTTTSTPQADEGLPLQSYGYQFFSNGSTWFRYGDWMHFTLIAPPGGSAYLELCNLGYQYALWNGGQGTNYIADIPAPYGYSISSCPVTAVYTAWNGTQYFVPYPVYVGLYTSPQPYIIGPGAFATPSPVPRAIGLPGERRPVPLQASPLPGPRPISKPVVKPVAQPPIKPVSKPAPVQKPIPKSPSLKPIR